MPIELEYDKIKSILRVTVIGEIIPHDIASAIEKITSSSEWAPNVDSLWDMRKTDFKSADEELWQRIIEILQRYPDRANYNIALIANSDLSYGMIRMYEILSEGRLPRKSMVFMDYSEGEKWILQNRSK